MDFNIPKQNEIAHVVFNENTLGYLFPWQGAFGLGILGSRITEGGIPWINSPRFIQPNELKQMRKATQQDFNHFRVSSKGHLDQR